MSVFPTAVLTRSLSTLRGHRLLEAAIDLYHRGLALTADSQLRSNLRITYINWAVGLVNGGKAKEALPILERAKAEFAGDADIEKVFEAARQRARP